jgi:hypothetical protein
MPSNPFCPNVLVTSEEEHELKNRYETAKSSINQQTVVQRFEDIIKNKSHIVINVKVRMLYRLVKQGQPYLPAYQVSGKEVEPKRREIDELFFGDCREEIRYAALSLDGWGLISWGPCTICLQEERMQHRVSLLEENSYKFRDNHPHSTGQVYPPPGYRASWQKRHELVVAKLHAKITDDIQDDDFAGLVMSDETDRMKADYVEVYICGSFTQDAIQYAGLMKEPTSEDDKAYLEVIKNKLEDEGKWKGMKK